MQGSLLSFFAIHGVRAIVFVPLKGKYLTIMETKKYSLQSALIGTGKVFIDPLTGLTFGIRQITFDRQAFGSITFPNTSSEEISNVSPGQKWNFSFNGKDYEVILLELNYLNDTFKAQITER